MLARMGRWALRYADKGPIHLGHRLGHIEGDPQIYRAVVYDKGAYVLHMLRQIVGEDAFRARGHGACRPANRFGKIGTDEVRAALEAASGLDLAALLRGMGLRHGLPELRLATRSRPEARAIAPRSPSTAATCPGPVPLEVAVAHPAGTEVRTVSLEPEGGSWTVDTPRTAAPRGRQRAGAGCSPASSATEPRRARGTATRQRYRLRRPSSWRFSTRRWSPPRAGASRSRARPRAPRGRGRTAGPCCR